LHAVLLNTASGCTEWRRYGVTHSQVMTRNSPIGVASSALWARASALIDDARSAGQLA
jgi:hypothetical protein